MEAGAGAAVVAAVVVDSRRDSWDTRRVEEAAPDALAAAMVDTSVVVDRNGTKVDNNRDSKDTVEVPRSDWSETAAAKVAAPFPSAANLRQMNPLALETSRCPMHPG